VVIKIAEFAVHHVSIATVRDSETLRPHLRRGLNLSALIALTFFCVAGGAYGLEDAVGAGGSFLALLGIIILPWLWSLPTALMTAELSTAMPEDGGYVVWVERAFGRFWGFQEGWLSWLCSFADNALYPVMFVDYLTYLRGDMPPTERWLIGTAVITAVTWINLRGIRLVGLSSIMFSLIVLAPFAIMVGAGAPQVETANWFQRADNIDWALLLSTLLWNTSGWDNAGCCAAEVINPPRNYPRAMIVTVVLVTTVYLLPMAVGVGVSNGNLLVTFANEMREEGMGPIEAAIEGGHVRFRPIIMTALAMILGMLPMALALGTGSEQNAPLGRAVIGGLFAATLMTLFVVPAVYSIFSRTLIGKKERDARIAAVSMPGA